MSEPLQVPEWLVNLVGRLTLENEALRQALAVQQPEPIPNGHVPEPEPAR